MENNPDFILLAGGKSERMGISKGLLQFKNTLWILEQLRRISESNITEVYIGLGYNYNLYFNAVDWFEKAAKDFVSYLGMDVKVMINLNPELGPFSTLHTILKNKPTNSDTFICPIDIPILNATDLNKITTIKNEVVIPIVSESHGHPIKMNINFTNKLIALPCNHKTSRLDYQIKNLNPQQISYLEIADKSILKNLNTPKEWNLFLEDS